ncbi:MAG TPA: dethiobiotin synthase [Flavitalea sp.]|nr:dethiobiotin synthase [Flavitalea sp.]
MEIPSAIFVTGTSTGIGKTLISAVLTEALGADYWKPVQAGNLDNTDSHLVRKLVTSSAHVHPETYRLLKASSPHIAAREEGVRVSLERIVESVPDTHGRPLVIEGAGGLLVPLNQDEFVADLIIRLKIPVVLVSRNVLGSINHSMLTALACREKNIPVMGWIFNDDYLDYEDEIVSWSGYPKLASIPFTKNPDRTFVVEQADKFRKILTAGI